MSQSGTTSSDERGPYIWLASGRKYFFLNPSPDDVVLEDILAGLHQLRWTGQAHVVGDLLVHSSRVALIAKRLGGTPQECATALFHDAHEAYLGDVSRPLKMAMKALVMSNARSPYSILEDAGKAVVAERFRLVYPHPEIVHLADNIVLAWEAILWGKDLDEAGLSRPDDQTLALLNDTPVHGWMTEADMRAWDRQIKNS